MKKNQIKATLLATLVGITLSGCNRREINFSKKELLSIIEENDLDLSQIYRTYRSEMFQNCTIVPQIAYDENELSSSFYYLYNSYESDYAKRFMQKYLLFLKETNPNELKTNSYITIENTDNGIEETIKYETNDGKYMLFNSESKKLDEETYMINTEYSNNYYKYYASIINKYKKMSGTKNQHLNTLENSCVYSMNFYGENNLSISIINFMELNIVKNEVNVNVNNYNLILYYNGELIEEQKLTENEFNSIMSELNIINENRYDYEEFITSEFNLARRINSKIKTKVRTKNN